jgi:hypothetical protein
MTLKLATFQANSEEVPKWRTEQHFWELTFTCGVRLAKEARSITIHMIGRANIVTSEGETLR